LLQRVGPFRIEGRFLRSRVARRIFVLIVLCALLPISSFALLSFHQVTAQLERDARDRLAQDAKQVGMTVLERLLLLDSTLRMLDTALLQGDRTPALETLPAALDELTRGRFLGLAVSPDALARSDGDPLLALFHGERDGDRRHLEQRGTWLRVVEAGATPRVVIAHLAESPSGFRFVAAELDPAFLFASDGLRPRTDLSVVTDAGVPVFRTTPSDAELPGGYSTTARLGAWPSTWITEESLTGTWSLFLQPIFRAPAWRFVLSEPTAAALAPMHDFRAVFPLIALLSLLGVGLASLMLIRRQLVPIETLHAATQRMAARDFAVRVEIPSNDEFGGLGRSFNQMAESIERQVAVMETVNGSTALSVERDRERLLGTLRRRDARDGRRRRCAAPDGCFEKPDRRLLRADRVGDLTGRSAPRRAGSRTRRAARRSTTSARAPSVPMRNHESEVIGVLQLVRRPAKEPSRATPAIWRSLSPPRRPSR
jgi:HAMP domain-containing protein